MKALIVNGPNLDRLGDRQPEIYGAITLDEIEDQCRAWGRSLGIEVKTFQSNSEADIIERVAAFVGSGIVLNPGALTHTSRALADAIAASVTPVVEVHISNIWERERWRRNSVIGPVCDYTIYGRGIEGYRHALRRLAVITAGGFTTHRYGPAPDMVGDLRLPDGHPPHPVVVLVHGGFWRHEWGRDLMDSLATDLSGRGIATWNVEFRRVGRGGGWPATGQDVSTAVDFLDTLAGVDTGRLVLLGHSSGGHLVLYVAKRGPVTPRLVVGLAPITDLESVPEAESMRACGAPSGADLIPLGCRSILVHGGDDRFVDPGHTTRFADPESETSIVDGAGHFTLLDPSKPWWAPISDLVIGEVRLPRSVDN